MIDVKNKRCICGKYPTFGLSTDKSPTCCASCKSPEMINIVDKKCVCGKQPNYGLPTDKTPTCCAPEMIDIVSKDAFVVKHNLHLDYQHQLVASIVRVLK